MSNALPPRCLFCILDDPDANRVLLRNTTCYVRWDNHPAAPGHVEIVPIRHVESWFDLGPAEVLDMYELAHVARRVIAPIRTPDGYTIGINEGRAAGRTIDHVHMHLIPRWFGDVPDPRGGVRRVLPCDPDAWAPRSQAVGSDGLGHGRDGPEIEAAREQI